MRKFVARITPNLLKSTIWNLRKIYYFPIDIIEGLNGRDSMIPPRSKNYVGGGDFEQIGQEFKNIFIDLADLQPNNRVLDVGCGIGRMAIPLTSYLSHQGGYWGVDIVSMGIDWCQSNISPKFENFTFLYSDVYNQHYNKKGKILARNYQFPFENEFFDFIFLTSVFTHMLPSDVENYLSEISRTLKPDGKCLITFFVLNEESEDHIRSGKSILDFRVEIDGCKTTNEDDPEAAIAYSDDFVNSMFRKYGLKIIRPIHYGSWCGRDSFLSYQDIIVAAKEKIN